MREVIRRVVAAACLYGGIALCLTHASGLYQIEPVDWSREVVDRQQHAEQITGMMSTYVGAEMLEGVDLASETRGTLDEYIAQETEGRLVTVSGPEWEGLWNDIARTVQDNAPSAAWAARRGVDYHQKSVYLSPEAGPLATLAGQWPEHSLLAYVRIDPVETGVSPRYLDVYVADASRIQDGAPPHIAFPYRTYGAAVLLSGLLFYIAFPRQPRPDNGIFYQARAAGWLPDLLATFGSGVFFAMPFLITGDADGGPLDPDWWPLTLIMWGMGSIFAVIFVVTIWYQTRRVTWDADGVDVQTWGTAPQHFAVDEVGKVGPYMLEAPRWLRTLAWIISMFNWRAASSAILLDRSDPGFVIKTTTGPSFRFTGDGLYGAESFLKWLDAHNVPVDGDARELMKTKSDYEPGKTGFVVGLIFAVLILGGVTPPLLKAATDAMPQPAPEFHAGSFDARTEFSRPVSGQGPAVEELPLTADTESALTDTDEPQVPVTPEMLAREQAIIKEIEAINEHLKTLRSQIGTVSNPNAVAIEESQRAMKRLRELQKEFDAVRRGQPTDENGIPTGGAFQ